MRILITGGAGCLGSNLIEHYLPQGHQIFVIDNFATGKKEVLPEMPGLTVVEGSIVNEQLVNDCIAKFKPTHVIHSAAAYKDPENWAEDALTNITGTIYVAKAALEHNVKRLINFQTALCYGRPEQLPIPSTHPTRPFTSYGISKTAGEAFLLNSGLSVVSLRLANICGPRLAIGPIPTFYKRLKENKACFCSDSIRDFLDMSDFISLMDILLRTDEHTGVFNVSTGEGHSIKEVFETVAEYLSLEVPEVPITAVGADDVQAVVLDSKDTINVFGWKPQFSFKDTIRRQLEWYDKYGISDVFSHLKQK
jgi:UDP-glucose 4-epimerase